MASPPTAAAAPRAVGAGRGLLYITAAKMWFMVGGSAIGFVLPHLLRDKASYGKWGFILSVVSREEFVDRMHLDPALLDRATPGSSPVPGASPPAEPPSSPVP